MGHWDGQIPGHIHFAVIGGASLCRGGGNNRGCDSFDFSLVMARGKMAGPQ